MLASLGVGRVAGCPLQLQGLWYLSQHHPHKGLCGKDAGLAISFQQHSKQQQATVLVECAREEAARAQERLENRQKRKEGAVHLPAILKDEHWQERGGD